MTRSLARTLVLATVLASLGGPAAAQEGDPPGPRLEGCPVLPADDIWNTPVDTLPVHPSSDAWVATVGADTSLKADFGTEWEGAPIGIPYVVVDGDQPRADITFEYADESDPGPYPIPADAPIEGGPDGDGDRHILVLDRDACTLYEVFDAHPDDDGSWSAGSGAVFDLSSSALRPDGWTSADAAGMPVLPGLVRRDEVDSGEIRHALRFTVPETQRAYLWPARHFASRTVDPAFPPMGARFRLRADLDISGFSPDNQVILRALQRYGMILADNGSAWFLSGVPDATWDDDELRELLDVTGADLEAVDVSSLMVDPDSGQARQPSGAASAAPEPTPASSAEPEVGSTPSAEPAATSGPRPAPSPLPSVDADLFVDAANTSGVEDGTRQAPFSSIQAAIDAASDGSVIAVAGGDYPGDLRVEGKAVDLIGGHTSYFASRDPGVNVTSLIGTGEESVVTLLDAGATTIDGFRIAGGVASSANEYGLLGGGVFVQGGTPTLSHLLVEGNDGTVAGAADNAMVGGGIYVDADAVTIRDSVIRDNRSGRGAGIAAFSGRTRIIDNLVERNEGVSDHGGGVYLAGPDIEVRGNRIVGNAIGRELGYGWGGGIIVFGQGSQALLTGNEVTGNFAPSVGAGVFIDDEAVATLDHERIHHNLCGGATSGGVGVYVDGYDGRGSVVEIRASTIAGNDCASAQGGNAVYVEGGSQVTIRDSILWGNGGDDVLVVDDSSSVTVATTLSEEPIEGAGNLSADPLFVDLATGDVRLRAGSPAIDAADPSSPFDLEPEPNGGRADLGAFGNTPDAGATH